jgi:hypothetical protein
MQKQRAIIISYRLSIQFDKNPTLSLLKNEWNKLGIEVSFLNLIRNMNKLFKTCLIFSERFHPMISNY